MCDGIASTFAFFAVQTGQEDVWYELILTNRRMILLGIEDKNFLISVSYL